MEASAQDIVKRLGGLKPLRDIHAPVWKDCYKYSYPLRMSGFFNETLNAQEGLEKIAEMTDSTTTESVRVFASHLMDGMTPSNTLWFGLDVGEESEEEKRWLSKAARTIWSNIHNGNFDSVGFESMIDAVCAGWFVLYVDEHREGGYHFEQWPISQCYVAASRAGEPIDTVYREFKLTADQAVSEYGEENVGEKIRKAVDSGKGSEKFEFIHAIYPRKMSVPGSRLAKNLPYASVTVDLSAKKVIRESGYHENPCIVPRWVLLPESAYAVGPVYDALPDAKTVNRIRELELANMDIAVSGMWIAEDDGVLTPRSIKIGPRRVVVANSVDSMKPLQSGVDFNVAFTAEDRIQNQIRKILLADLLPPVDGQPRTATEMNIRMSYIRQMLGPVFARLQSEYLQPLIERCFGIAYRAGVLGQPPASLGNRSFSVKYESPLARAQKLSEVTAIDQYVQGLVQVSEFDPSVLDNVDFDKAARYRGEALGVPTDIIPTTKEIQNKRNVRAEQQRAQKEQAMRDEVVMEAGTAAAKRVAQ